MTFCAYFAVDSGTVTRFFPVVPAEAPPSPDQPVMYLNLVATGTPTPAPPVVTLTMEASPAVVIPYQGSRDAGELDSPTVAGFAAVQVTYGPLGAAPPPGAGESQFQLAFFLASGTPEVLRSTVWSIRIDASGDATGQSFSWSVSDSPGDGHAVVLPALAARRAAVTGALQVGTDPSAVAITRFTGEAIATLSSADLVNTVPTSGGVKTHVAGAATSAVNAAVTGSPGSYPKFTAQHVLGASAVSESGSTVTVAAALSVNNGNNPAASTLNVLGATGLQNTLTVGGLLSAPAGVLVEGSVAHLDRDGAFYRNTDGQCYLTVDDHLFIRDAGAPSWAAHFDTDAGALDLKGGLTAQGAAALQSTLKVGAAGTAVTITRFTSEPIAGLSDADRQSTVPTGAAVKSYVDGVAGAASGRLLAVKALTAPGTVTPTAGTKRVRVRMIGGGGGGGGAKVPQGAGAGSAAAAAGGSSGVLIELWIAAQDPVTYGSYTCGTGGAGGAVTGTTAANGADGGDTTIVINAVTYTAKGGAGGPGVTNSSPSGLPRALAKTPAAGSSSGVLASYGLGGNGYVLVGSPLGGAGGSSPLGAGGLVMGNAAGSGGGGGGGEATTSASQPGGNGAPGCIIIEEYS